MERKERKEAKRSKLNDEGFEVVSEPKQLLGETAEKKMSTMSDSQKKKALQAMELIKAGMGLQHPGRSDSVDPPGFDVVPAVHVDLPVMDTRKYDSENEDYDSDDHARTLALGTMMLRRSKEKALVDACYNRFAWNDPEDLPDAKQKLAAAKKKAEAVANNPDMSEATKLKAISKAMRGQEMSRPGKTYVVAKRGLTKGGKGIKLVDSRMKSDKRSMERTMKKKKFGKKGGADGYKA
jgi:hypothetical protein